MSISLNNGMSIPALGYGTYALSEPTQCAYNAIAEGFRHLDCAHCYGNEKEIGVGLKRAFDEGLVKREDLWITSKLWNDDHAVEDVEKACDLTLSNLGVEYLDLYLIHWPVAWKKGTKEVTTDVSLVETYNAMEKLVDAGKVKALGISNFSVEEAREIYENSKHKPVINQVESHPYFNQLDLEKGLKEFGIVITSYSPIRCHPANAPTVTDIPVIQEIAAKHNVTTGQAAVRWHVDLGRVVIPKCNSVERIRENFGVTKFKLDAEDIEKINQVKPQVRCCNFTGMRGDETTPFFSE